MTPILALIVAVMAALAGGLVFLVVRQRRRIQQLDQLLLSANERLERLQVHFGRFAPDDVIEQLTEPGRGVQPSRRTVTVLFADLWDFTSMCDRLDAGQIVPILNGYFRAMSEAIASHHGRVTEMTGDGLLALFGALELNPWQAQDAVLGALAMRTALRRYNQQLRARALPELRFGIGIHQGEVLAGVMGNDELSKFGVVGDTINVAARVEKLTRVHGADLLITEDVRSALDARFRLRAMPPIPVKGKPKPIATYLVEGVEASMAEEAVQPS